jgi:hypothetical protein
VAPLAAGRVGVLAMSARALLILLFCSLLALAGCGTIRYQRLVQDCRDSGGVPGPPIYTGFGRLADYITCDRSGKP